MSAPVKPELVVKIAEAKGRLSELIQRAEAGERLVIARGNDPVVVLQPVHPVDSPIGIFARMGVPVDLEGVHAGVDTPWSEAELDAFEGDLEDELKR